MKKQRKSPRYASRTVLLLALTALLFSIFAPFIPIQKAQAASGDSYVLYYPDDEATKQQLKKAYDKSGSDKFTDPAMEKVSIMASGGTLFGDKPQRLVYDMAVNKNMNERNNDNDFDGHNQYFTRVYYCNAKTGAIGYSAPEGKDEYYRVTYAVALTDMKDSSKLFDIGTHNKNAVGATKILKITPAKAGASGQAGEPEKTETIKDLDSGAKYFQGDDAPSKLGDDIDKMNPPACRPTPVGEGKIAVKNYYKDATNTEKEAIKGLVTTADAAASSTGGDNTDAPNCEISGSPLSWIVCPVIDLGTAFTDFVFNTFVRGLLEDVPIETVDGNGSYEAWKQFRLLGNVLLIGAMLAVVYSQAKGGK